MEVTKWLKPSVQRVTNWWRASVQAAGRPDDPFGEGCHGWVR